MFIIVGLGNPTPGEYVRQFQERQKTKSDVH